jgi:hypothetical protein
VLCFSSSFFYARPLSVCEEEEKVDFTPNQIFDSPRQRARSSALSMSFFYARFSMLIIPNK